MFDPEKFFDVIETQTYVESLDWEPEITSLEQWAATESIESMR